MFGGMKRRILFVQGSIRLRLAAAVGMSKAGIRSWTATTAEQCLDLLKCEPMDLVLLDILSQDIDGPGVYERIRWICPRVPIIFTADCSESLVRTAASQLNADGYLVFPMNDDEFVARIRGLLLLEESRLGRRPGRFFRVQRRPCGISLGRWDRRAAVAAKQEALELTQK